MWIQHIRLPWWHFRGTHLYGRPSGNLYAASIRSLVISLFPHCVCLAVCRLCVHEEHFYVRAGAAAAHCEPCAEHSSSGLLVMMTVLLSFSLVATMVVLPQYARNRWNHLNRWKRFAQRMWSAATEHYSLHNKLKVAIGT